MQAAKLSSQMRAASAPARKAMAPRLPKGVAPFMPHIAPRVSVVMRATMRETKLVPTIERGELSDFPGSAGVYAVYDKAGTLQYIGLSRKVRPRKKLGSLGSVVRLRARTTPHMQLTRQ